MYDSQFYRWFSAYSINRVKSIKSLFRVDSQYLYNTSPIKMINISHFFKYLLSPPVWLLLFARTTFFVISAPLDDHSSGLSLCFVLWGLLKLGGLSESAQDSTLLPRCDLRAACRRALSLSVCDMWVTTGLKSQSDAGVPVEELCGAQGTVRSDWSGLPWAWMWIHSSSLELIIQFYTDSKVFVLSCFQQ